MSHLLRWWRDAAPVYRVVSVLIAAALALNLAGFVIDDLMRGRREGPPSSSFATDATGLAAYVELLDRNGYEVDLSGDPPSAADLDSGWTVFVLDPPEIPAAEVAALRRFVSSGGRLVVGGSSEEWAGLIDHLPEWAQSSSAGVLRPVVPVPEVEGVDTAVAGGDAVWIDPAGTLPALGDPATPVLSVASPDDGRVAFLADASPLQNRWLPRADNAALGLSLAGDPERPVVFIESFHGYAEATGFGAIPLRWRWALALLAVAGAAWMAAHARRLGPPDRVDRALPPARRRFVDALGATLSRTPHKHEAIEPLLERGRALLRRRLHLDPTAGDPEIKAAAESSEKLAAEAAAVLSRIRSEHDVLRAGRAIATLSEGDR